MGQYTECPDCDNGWIDDDQCETCGGSGMVENDVEEPEVIFN